MIRFDNQCNVCDSEHFERICERVDGIAVLRCSVCGHGVVQHFKKDVATLYSDDYFSSEDQSGIGYYDYDYTAEHGVSWASALIRLLRPSGTLLDIGCADGHLLQKLDGTYQRFGIEPNHRAAEKCRSAGIRILASDILDETLLRNYTASFDIVAAIAVFEHIPNFRGAIEAALALLRSDGLLLFEVPIISDHSGPAEPWFGTSLEHIHYPTHQSLRYLFEHVLGINLAGSACQVVNFASVYVGLASKSPGLIEQVGTNFHRWCSAPPADLQPDEARFRWLFDVIHLAKNDPEVLALNGHLTPSDVNLNIVRRLSELWASDIASRNEIAAYLAEVELARDWHAGESRKKDGIIDTPRLGRNLAIGAMARGSNGFRALRGVYESLASRSVPRPLRALVRLLKPRSGGRPKSAG